MIQCFIAVSYVLSCGLCVPDSTFCLSPTIHVFRNRFSGFQRCSWAGAAMLSSSRGIMHRPSWLCKGQPS